MAEESEGLVSGGTEVQAVGASADPAAIARAQFVAAAALDLTASEKSQLARMEAAYG